MDVTPGDIQKLAEREVNGRQIKNAVRTAHSLAIAKGEMLSMKHLLHSLNAMDDFARV